MGSEDLDMFSRQRRNLMALSLFLIVAKLPTSWSQAAPLGATLGKVGLDDPFTIGFVLWLVWGCWLWRYYTYFNAQPEGVFSGCYFTAMGKILNGTIEDVLRKDSGDSKVVKNN